MQFDIFKQGAQLAAPTNVAGRATGKRRGAHVIHESKAALRGLADDADVLADLCPALVTRFKPGKAENCDGLTKKRARAIGMFEGWREVINEPIRQRVGLAGMQY